MINKRELLKIRRIAGWRERDILDNLKEVKIIEYYNGHPVYEFYHKDGYHTFEYTNGRITG